MNSSNIYSTLLVMMIGTSSFIVCSGGAPSPHDASAIGTSWVVLPSAANNTATAAAGSAAKAETQSLPVVACANEYKMVGGLLVEQTPGVWVLKSLESDGSVALRFVDLPNFAEFQASEKHDSSATVAASAATAQVITSPRTVLHHAREALAFNDDVDQKVLEEMNRNFCKELLKARSEDAAELLKKHLVAISEAAMMSQKKQSLLCKNSIDVLSLSLATTMKMLARKSSSSRFLETAAGNAQSGKSDVEDATADIEPQKTAGKIADVSQRMLNAIMLTEKMAVKEEAQSFFLKCAGEHTKTLLLLNKQLNRPASVRAENILKTSMLQLEAVLKLQSQLEQGPKSKANKHQRRKSF